MTQLVELEQRRESIVKSLTERNLLTDELKSAVEGADTLSALEDLYAPYRPKRRTRATIAREAGLEPLADLIFHDQATLDPTAAAAPFVNAEKQSPTSPPPSPAHGTSWPNAFDDALARARLRELYWNPAPSDPRSSSARKPKPPSSRTTSTGPNRSPRSPATACSPSAAARGGLPPVRITPPEEEAIALLEPMFVKAPGTPAGEQVRLAVVDSYKRLLGFAIEAKCASNPNKRRTPPPSASSPTTSANCSSPRRSAKNASSPSTPASAPAAKRWCSIAKGKLLHHDVIYPTAGKPAQIREAGETLRALVQKFTVEAIAIGNGTASRETEAVRARPQTPRQCRHRSGQRKRRLHLLRQRSRPRGVPQRGPHRARRGQHRPPPHGSPRGTGEARPQIHRRRGNTSTTSTNSRSNAVSTTRSSPA
jgi:uncharacterized protein